MQKQWTNHGINGPLINTPSNRTVLYSAYHLIRATHRKRTQLSWQRRTPFSSIIVAIIRHRPLLLVYNFSMTHWHVISLISHRRALERAIVAKHALPMNSTAIYSTITVSLYSPRVPSILANFSVTSMAQSWIHWCRIASIDVSHWWITKACARIVIIRIVRLAI